MNGVEEIAGGMNFKRKKFMAIMERIEHGEIKEMVIAHKDRFVRFGFGFEYFASFAQQHGCKIIVANQEHLSPQQEMVEDLMSIIHTFSCRLYGYCFAKSRKVGSIVRVIITAS